MHHLIVTDKKRDDAMREDAIPGHAARRARKVEAADRAAIVHSPGGSKAKATIKAAKLVNLARHSWTQMHWSKTHSPGLLDRANRNNAPPQLDNGEGMKVAKGSNLVSSTGLP